MTTQTTTLAIAVTTILANWTKGQGNTAQLPEKLYFVDDETIHAHGKEYKISKPMQGAKLLQMLAAGKVDAEGFAAMEKGFLSTAHERAHKGSEATKALPPTTNAARVKSAEEYRQDIVREYGLKMDYMGLFLALQTLKGKGEKSTRKDYMDFALNLESLLFPEDKKAVYDAQLIQEEEDKKQFQGLLDLGMVRISRGEKAGQLIGFIPAVSIDKVMSGLASAKCKLINSVPSDIDGSFHLKVTLEQSATEIKAVV